MSYVLHHSANFSLDMFNIHTMVYSEMVNKWK